MWKETVGCMTSNVIKSTALDQINLEINCLLLVSVELLESQHEQSPRFDIYQKAEHVPEPSV
jgi:hypothetical protein